MPYPNFFIVGAPRCASTFLYTYLRQHPDIFMPAEKEPRYFCSDLDSGSAADGQFFIREEERYLSLFTAAGSARRVGEACVANLYSAVAASRIKQRSPEARIIIMLRDPVEQMYSYHGVRRRWGSEDLDFEDALAAEADRREGRRLPRLARNLKMYQYRAVASYSDQVARYFDTFGRDRVHVIIFEDLVRDPAATFRATLEFLDVDPEFQPELAVVGAHSRNRIPALARLAGDLRYSAGLRAIIPKGAHALLDGALNRLNRWNKRPATRVPMNANLDRGLRIEFAAEVARTGLLLGRDLTVLWHSPPPTVLPHAQQQNYAS